MNKTSTPPKNTKNNTYENQKFPPARPVIALIRSVWKIKANPKLIGWFKLIKMITDPIKAKYNMYTIPESSLQKI